MAEESLERAVRHLRRGGLVLFPTETVFGLGASLWNRGAVERIYLCKRRPRQKPLAWHLGSLGQAAELGLLPQRREVLRFLPGPLSLLLPAPRWGPSWSQREGRIGLRVVSDVAGAAFLQAADLPVLATSANRSGHLSARTAEEALAATRSCHPLLLPGGEVRGLESTLLDLTGEVPVLRRRGAVAEAALRNLLPDLRVEAQGGPLPGLTLLVGSREAVRAALEPLLAAGDRVAAPTGLLPGALSLGPGTVPSWREAADPVPLRIGLPWEGADPALLERLWNSAERVVNADAGPPAPGL